jgi:HK97 family phage portal protein
MAENIFKRVANAITNKNHTFTLTSNSTNRFGILNGVLDYLTGKKSFKAYTKAYGDNPLVYMIIKKISFTSASIKRVATDSNGTIIDNSKLLEFLENPNQEQGMLELYEEINEYLSTTGNAFIHWVEDNMGGGAVEVLDVGMVEVICDNAGVVRYDYTHNSIVTPIQPDNILHIKSGNIVDPKTKLGLSPLQAGWIVVQSSSEKLNADASIFKNRGIVGLLTNDTDVPMLDKEVKNTQDSFQQTAGGSDNYNKIAVTNTRLRFLQTGMSPTDLKLLEGILSSLRILCGLYGMPSVLFNDNETSTYNNVSEAKQTAYTDVYIPLGKKVDKALSQFLNGKLKVNEKIVIDVTSIEVLKATTNELAQALSSLRPLLANKVLEAMTENEIREVVDLGVLTSDQITIGRQAVEPTITVEA